MCREIIFNLNLSLKFLEIQFLNFLLELFHLLFAEILMLNLIFQLFTCFFSIRQLSSHITELLLQFINLELKLSQSSVFLNKLLTASKQHLFLLFNIFFHRMHLTLTLLQVVNRQNHCLNCIVSGFNILLQFVIFLLQILVNFIILLQNVCLKD